MYEFIRNNDSHLISGEKPFECEIEGCDRRFANSSVPEQQNFDEVICLNFLAVTSEVIIELEVNIFVVLYFVFHFQNNKMRI